MDKQNAGIMADIIDKVKYVFDNGTDEEKILLRENVVGCANLVYARNISEYINKLLNKEES